MRKLVLILIAFIAVVTFIRAFDRGEPSPTGLGAGAAVIHSESLHAAGAIGDTESNN